MSKIKWSSGLHFGDLITIRKVGIKDEHSLWECQCKCGNIVQFTTSDLSKRKTKGCFKCRKDPLRKKIKSAWTNMNIRAENGLYFKENIKNECYKGVFISFSRKEFELWCEDRREHILSLTRPSIDRIDNKLGYDLTNIQFIELKYNIRKDKTVFKNGYGTCYRCKQTKLEEEFCNRKKSLNGKISVCIICERERCKEKSMRLKNLANIEDKK